MDGNFNGVGVRWRRPEIEEVQSTKVAQRFLKYQGGEKGHRRHEKSDNFEDVLAGVVKAFVGLIYRERVGLLSPFSPLFPVCTTRRLQGPSRTTHQGANTDK